LCAEAETSVGSEAPLYDIFAGYIKRVADGAFGLEFSWYSSKARKLILRYSLASSCKAEEIW
jgi:hypothetical protein